MGTVAPYGTWKSPITSEAIVKGGVGLMELASHGEDAYWVEVRLEEKGRSVLVRHRPGKGTEDVTPEPWSVRTRVHEYGCGSFLPYPEGVFFSHFADQRLYRFVEGGEPVALTPEEPLRYADGVLDSARNRIVCVREDHRLEGREAVNTLVSLDLDEGGEGTVLAGGNDFYSTPRISPDGSRICWLTWNHPNMPWDGNELWVADLDEEGKPAGARCVAGGERESVFQPEWSPDGDLVFANDPAGWWNLYRLRGGEVEALCPREAEFGRPQWGFGMSVFAFLDADRIVTCYRETDAWRLAILDTRTGVLDPVETPFTVINAVRAAPGRVMLFGASPIHPICVASVDLESGRTEILRRSSDLEIAPEYLSVPETIAYETEGGLTAYGHLFRPKNDEYQAPEGERPPLVVTCHGGPTGCASPVLSAAVHFWTSRGFALIDVDYGGSTGYGRAYRERLNGNWGVVDVDDCVNAARHLVAAGEVDGDRLAIRGGSAGGYTVLAALTFRDVFRAGASFYGVSDLIALQAETHKFESRYEHNLVGPYPETEELWKERSPIFHTEGLSCPVIFLQGLDDPIVPPNQAELMVDALREKGIPVAYLPFAGEQHGFRKSENVRRAYEAELYFYGRIFGFTPADRIDPVPIENL